MVALNPDEPKRPVNSPNNCYQITPRALGVMCSYEYTSDRWRDLDLYLAEIPGLRAQYQRGRMMLQIPVNLPEGSQINLTPGGQNKLIKQIIEEFCPRFTPRGRVLYIGEAGKEDPIYREADLKELGIELDKHGKFPDLIVHMPDRHWLVVLEAAPRHGPVDEKRYRELNELFASARAGCVYVSCFSSRTEMRKYLNEIAWETEVWCADDPSHMIHFNGERFLGPHGG